MAHLRSRRGLSLANGFCGAGVANALRAVK